MQVAIIPIYYYWYIDINNNVYTRACNDVLLSKKLVLSTKTDSPPMRAWHFAATVEYATSRARVVCSYQSVSIDLSSLPKIRNMQDPHANLRANLSSQIPELCVVFVSPSFVLQWLILYFLFSFLCSEKYRTKI